MSLRKSVGLICCLAILPCLTPSPALAQQTTKKVPEPRDLILDTKDHVSMTATYYPSVVGKEAVPVIMLHGFKGSRADYHPLALALQQRGYAVIVPDLRGHGGSKKFQNGRSIDVANMPANQYPLMVNEVEACKKFLIKENNAGQLNIDKLCLVASDFSTITAVNYAAADWSFPPLGGYKQGQDVKALVLLSPERAFKTNDCSHALGSPAVEKFISMYVLVGSNKRSAVADARRVYQGIERMRNKEEKKSIFVAQIPTTLQGTKLLALKDVNAGERIGAFFQVRVGQQSFPWKERRSPLAGD